MPPSPSPAEVAKAKWDQRFKDRADNDLSGGGAPPSRKEAKAEKKDLQNLCSQGAPCTVAHGRGKTHCAPMGGGTCRATECDTGFHVDTETLQASLRTPNLPPLSGWLHP